MNKDTLEEVINSDSKKQAAVACASNCAVNYQSIVEGYRVCTLSKERICEYSVNDIVNHITEVGIVFDSQHYNGYYIKTHIQEYTKCSKGLMPISEIVERAKVAIAVRMVKGHFVW